MQTTTPCKLFPFETRSVMLFAALAVGGASSLFAQVPAPPVQSSPFTAGAHAPAAPSSKPSPVNAAFDRADANRDNQLDAKEAQALPAISDRFEQLDTNRDGLLSREEFTAGTRT